MDAVKTYQQVSREDERMSFGVSKMEEVYKKHNGKPDAPHRHNFFTVIITEQAKGQHFIDFNEYTLGANQIYFISPGQVHQLIEVEASVGIAMTFSHEFLAKNNIPVSFIDDLNLFNDFGESPPLLPNETNMMAIRNYAHQIFDTFHSDITFKYEACGSLLKLILILCNNSCSLPKGVHSTIDNRNSVLSSFKNLINENFNEWHGTKEYADELHISPDYLNKLIKSQTGKTAKEHIQNRIIVAAKRLIYFTDLSNKEIGYELGFSEPANFSAFFKNCVGMSPSQFKENS